MRITTLLGLIGVIVLLAGPLPAKFKAEPVAETKVEVKETVIPYEVKYIFSRDIGAGRIKKAVNGINGKKTVTFTHTLLDGVVVKSEKSVEVVEPKAAVFHMGKPGFTASRGSFTRSTVKIMKASAYVPSDGSGSGITATGRRAKYGIVAVDPNVIPLDTLVFVEGYGFAVAADTGGAIKGNKIDLCMESRAKALRFGRREVVVHIFHEKNSRDKR